MTVDFNNLQSSIRKSLSDTVEVHQREDGIFMLDTSFAFPDGDHYPIYLREANSGNLELSDLGQTLMHISYENDVDALYRGRRATHREQIVSQCDVREKNGQFFVETTLDQIAEALFRLVQAITKIYGLTEFGQVQRTSDFNKELREILCRKFDEDRFTEGYLINELDSAEHYPVDFCFNGTNRDPLFLYGVHNQAKTRLTTISLSHFRINGLQFDSIIVFEDQLEIPNSDIARLETVSGTTVSSLAAERELEQALQVHLD